eukprot:5223577-Lingulodinium_polyedra.AAC.1
MPSKEAPCDPAAINRSYADVASATTVLLLGDSGSLLYKTSGGANALPERMELNLGWHVDRPPLRLQYLGGRGVGPYRGRSTAWPPMAHGSTRRRALSTLRPTAS